MDWITAAGLERSRLTVLLMIGLLLLGATLYNSFPKREDPEISIRQSVVTIQFPGMSPQRMENLIADPAERKIREIPEVDEIETRVTTGEISIEVSAKDSISDLDQVWQELRDKMEEVARELPEGSLGPFVNTNFGDVSIASIAMTGEGFSMREIELQAEELQRKLYLADGIAKVDLFGVQDERVWLEIDAERLASVGLQLETLISDLQNQNVILPSGSLNAGGNRLLLETSGDFETVAEIERMITRVEGLEDFIRLGDLVNVRRGSVSPKEQPVFYQGRPSVVVSVQMQSGYDIEAVGKSIRAITTQFENSLPIGYALHFATFQPTKVTEAVNAAVSNVLQTFAVVLLVIMVFLGIRSGLIIASIVPLAVMFSLIGMSVLGISLEQVSIAAIIISLGLLVDNGVVTVEDILSKVSDNETPHNAALQAGRQFAVPLLVSSLTTIFAFMPFFLMEGSEGEYAFSLGAVVTLTLIGSWISSIYFLPFICKHFLRKPNLKQTDNRLNTSIRFLTDSYRKLLTKVLPLAPGVLFFCYGLVLLSGFMFGSVPQEMFPLSDRNQVLLYQDMPKGTDIGDSEKTAAEVSSWLMDKDENPEVTNHISYIGSGGPRFYLSLDPADSAPESAFTLVNFTDQTSAVDFTAKAKRYLIERHPEARFKVKRLSMGAGESGSIKIKVSGTNLTTLMDAANSIETAFTAAPGISVNENDWGEKTLKVLIRIDQDKARRTGVTSESISQLLSAYFDGYEISSYREDKQSVPIVMRASEQNRDSADDLLNIVVGSGNEAISLEQIAVLEPQLEYSQIRRLDQLRTITVTARSDVLTAGELLGFVQPHLDQLDLPAGYELTLGGEIADSSETNEKLANGLPYAFLLMLVVIVYQFNSFRRTLIIFMSIPLVIIGVPFGLMLFGQPMSFFGTLGIISLAGIIINNAIVLIDQIDIERASAPLQQAIIRASALRFRPILLTSATTVIGLVPLYLFGGSLWTPLAIVMMSGLAVASLLTLVFVPAAYQLFFRGESTH
ncbi:MAG: efflux RND transporter permease subunit [Halioglobus sp.]